MISEKSFNYKSFKTTKKYKAISSVAYPVIFGLLILVLWQTQILHKMIGTDTFTLPVPTKINSIIVENWSKIWLNLKSTIQVSLIGLFIGSILGYLIAIIGTVFTKWGKGGITIVAAISAVPAVALAPVITNWTKDVSDVASIRSMFAKIVVVSLLCMGTMGLNAFRGLTELKPFSEDLMKTYAAKKFTVFTKLRLPNSIPYIFIALRVSVPASIITTMVSEYFAEYITGIGRQIRENIVLAQYSTAWAYIIIACLLGIAMYVILIVVEGIILKNRK